MAQVSVAAVAEPLPERLRKATRPAMVETAPGKWVPANPRAEVAEYVLSKWRKNADGTYTAIPFRDHLQRLDGKLARILGFPSGWNTIRRLGRAGFVELLTISPGVTLINLDSWFNHLRRCAENPELWEKGGKWYRAYKDAL
jgi:hypothetical protein